MANLYHHEMVSLYVHLLREFGNIFLFAERQLILKYVNTSPSID